MMKNNLLTLKLSPHRFGPTITKGPTNYKGKNGNFIVEESDIMHPQKDTLKGCGIPAKKRITQSESQGKTRPT